METNELYALTHKTWDLNARAYQEKFMELDLYNDTYDEFCRLIVKTGASVLDAGCGPGNISRYLLNKKPDLKITGIDVSPNMIALAAKNNPEAAFIDKDILEFEPEAQEFNAIICGFCLPYLKREDASKFIHACYKSLAPDGVLYLSLIEGNYSESALQKNSLGNQCMVYYYSETDVKEMLCKNNFNLVSMFRKSYHAATRAEETHLILIAGKQKSRPV